MNKVRVDVRVEPELLEELDAISERFHLGSRSASIREAIANYVMEGKESWNSRAVKVNIPNRLAERLQRHIMSGDAMDVDNAMILALDFWLRDLEDYYINRKSKIDRIVRECIEADGAMKELEDAGKDLWRP